MIVSSIRPSPGNSFAAALRRLRWPTLLFWALLLVVLAPAANKLSQVTSNTAAAYLPASAQSTKVATLQTEALGRRGQPESDQAVAVFARSGPLTAADRRAIAAADRAVSALRVTGLRHPGPQRLSADGKAELFTVDIVAPQHGVTTADQNAVRAIRSVVEAHASNVSTGLQAAVTGPAAVSADSGSGTETTLLLTAIMIVAIILLLVYRSPVLWLLPVLSAINAIVVAEAAAHGLASAGLTVSSLSASILIVLVFGAATDYALLLTHRYREELRRYPGTADAMAVALRATFGTLLASASTVVIAMLCMLAASSGSLHGLGPVAAVAIVAAFSAQTTLLPALLLVLGRWVFWPSIPRHGEVDREASPLWSKAGSRLLRRPAQIAVGTMILLAAAAIALTGLHITSDPASTLKGHPGSVVGQQLISAHFPAGDVAALVMLTPPAHAQAAARAARSVPGVTSVAAGQPVHGHASFTITLSGSPYSPQGFSTIRAIRDRTAARAPGSLIGGNPAVQLDISTAAGRDDVVLIPLILGVVLIVTGLLLRAIVAPLVLVALSALSFAASFGLSVLLWGGLHYQGVDPQVPIYIFLFLVALGVDYNIFLIARIREESRWLGTTAGTLRGLAVTGGVITAAGLVLAGTFAALTQLPSVSVTEVGSAVAIGVLVDTVLVRSVLTPSLILTMGAATWWPRKPAAVPPQAAKCPATTRH
ncbi:MAG TPA: MMPL family transporter [Streptosporangiaceae bacterium]|jgi:RND superfamily putative drug exporter